jgi:hypothetical protein
MVHCVYHKKLTLKHIKYQGRSAQRYSSCTHSARQSVLDRYMDPSRCSLRHVRPSQITPENINSEATKSCNDLDGYLKKTVKRNLIFCKLGVTSINSRMTADMSRSFYKAPKVCLPISNSSSPKWLKSCGFWLVTKPISSKTGLPINGWTISSSTMICRTPRMHIGRDGVVIVTSDMSISFALHFYLSLSPLIVMFSMMGSGNASTLRGKPRFLASFTALRGIAE